MKKLLLTSLLLVLTLAATGNAQAQRGQRGGGANIFAPPATASGPIADMMKAVVTAFNKGDTAYFQRIIAPDAVWFDEDGHTLQATVWMNRILSANPPRKLSITNLRVGNWDNSGWAGFNYALEGTNQV